MSATKLVVLIDMDDVLCDYTRAFQRAIERNPKIQLPQSQYGFFTDLDPLPNAIASVNALRDSSWAAPYILTAPSVRNPVCYTEKRIWVEHYFGMAFVNRLIICAHKGWVKGHILIDDHSDGKGQEDFSGRLIQFGSSQYPDWNSVIAELGRYEAILQCATEYFGDEKRATSWLGEPARALGGESPVKYVRHPDGDQAVMNLIGALKAGSYV